MQLVQGKYFCKEGLGQQQFERLTGQHLDFNLLQNTGGAMTFRFEESLVFYKG